MNTLLHLREKANLTQEELSRASGISVRTIQRIESGQIPRGYTLKALANALEVEEPVLTNSVDARKINDDNITYSKILNISSLLFTLFLPLNILVPLAMMLLKKQSTIINRTLISIQILWTLIAVFLFIIILILNDWFGITSRFKMLIPLVWISVNIIIIVRNAIALNKTSDISIFPNINIL